jgi:uncharacterized lipoprotein
MIVKKIITGCMLVGFLSGCTLSPGTRGEQVYLASQNGMTLQIKPPLTAANISHFYDLPSEKGDVAVNIEPPVV